MAEILTGEEFAAKYLEGRRDFSEIEIPNRTDMRPYIQKLNSSYDTTKPLILHGSKLVKLIVPKILLYGANLEGVDFTGADISNADFAKANCRQTDFSGANLRRAYFWMADCRGAIFNRADLAGSDFDRANLEGVDFRKAKNRKKIYSLDRKLRSCILIITNDDGTATIRTPPQQ